MAGLRPKAGQTVQEPGSTAYKCRWAGLNTGSESSRSRPVFIVRELASRLSVVFGRDPKYPQCPVF